MSLARRLVSGTTQLTIANGVVRLISIFTMPILTALLSPQAYGEAALAGTVIALVSVLALAGIDMSYARAYHSATAPNGALVERFCWRFVVVSALVSAMVAGFVWWSLRRETLDSPHLITGLVTVGIFFSPVNAMALTRSRLRSRYRAMALAIIASGIICAATSISVAMFWRHDAAALLFPLVLNYLVPSLLLGTPSPAALTKPVRMGWDQGSNLLKIGLAGIVIAPMYWLLSSFDRWFLQYFHGAESVGIYSIGYSVAVVGMMVNSAIISAWLPEASREYEQNTVTAPAVLGRLTARLILGMALMWLAVTAAGGDIIRWLANERFHSSAEIVPFLAAGVFFYGASQMGLSGLMLVRKAHWAALWWLMAGVMSATLNLLLVPSLGGLGAAITQSASFAFVAAVTFATAQRYFTLRLPWFRLIAVITIISSAGVLMSDSWNPDALASLAQKFPVGFGVLTLTSWLIAPDWCQRCFCIFLRLK